MINFFSGESVDCVLVGVSNISIEIPSIKVNSKMNDIKLNLISKPNQNIIEANLGINLPPFSLLNLKIYL